jgi:hypothetical protein
LRQLAVAVIALYYYQMSFHNFPSSYHRIFLVFTVLLSLSGADKTLSLRMKRERGSFTAWEPVPAWPQRLIAFQICATYFGVALQKLVLPLWQTGEVLSYSFTGRWGTPFAFWFARLNLPLWFYDHVIDAVKFLHITLPFAVWFPKLRWYAMGAGALFHIGVTLTMGMWWFLAMIPAYVVFFNPEDVRRWMMPRLQSPRHRNALPSA